MTERPRVLIESWFPIETIGAESLRDASAAKKPPLNRLHVWWARRPLTVSRAAILASVLPEWSDSWPKTLKHRFPRKVDYHAWFLELCGIFGDPVAGRKRIQRAKDAGIRLKKPPYTHKRAFTISPSQDYLETLGDLVEHTWGKRQLSMLDSFAGGGAIPFEALRYHFKTYANELNPVASVILKATLDYPASHGPQLTDHIKRFGTLLSDRVRKRLEQFFPAHQPGESIHAYIWALTVPCPYTGKTIPLVPNWWLKKRGSPIAAQPIFDGSSREARFEIVEGKDKCALVDPNSGTIRRGNAISPWADNQPVTGHYIKDQARQGRMSAQLYAIAIKTSDGMIFRSPRPVDLEACAEAEREVERNLASWESRDLLPSDERYIGPSDRLENYGILTFDRMFAPRQLLSLVVTLEELLKIGAEIQNNAEHCAAIRTYLAIALDKSADYNSTQCHWDPTRFKVANTFNLHDFRPRWNFAEFDASRNLLPWTIKQVADAYYELSLLATGELHGRSVAERELTCVTGKAADLGFLENECVPLICVDPPYYDNVIYSECADFFYVWMKRSIGDLYPSLFIESLTNKDDETVANSERFKDSGRRAKKLLASRDYERKMTAAFREMHRVLTDDGVLTVMFTHKKVEAWDTLATSLIGAGFAIHSSWPVHTESEHSLHQAKKNAAKSTILLTCRKREPDLPPVWWEDLRAKVTNVARQKAEEFEAQGIHGVDLYISTFGPTLALLSENWPVLTSEVDEATGDPIPLKPEIALDLARQVVVDLRKKGLLLGRAVQFDTVTDWYLMAWDAFRAERFPADEARKLALALGLDLEGQVIAEKRLVSKKSADVVLQQPRDRRRRGMVDPDVTAFGHWIDAAHTAMLLYDEDGSRAAEQFLSQAGLNTDSTFKALIQALINAIPRTRVKGNFIRPEAATLEAFRLAFFDDLEVPIEEEPEILEPAQKELF